MANVHQKPIINPFRLVDYNAYTNMDARYNSFPFDFKVDGKFNPNGYYAQKWQINDFTAIQIDSDFVPSDFQIFEYDGGEYFPGTPYASFPFTPKPNNISLGGVPVSWVLYESQVSFADFDPGIYVGVYTYTDQNDVVQTIQTSPLDVRTNQAGTLLYEYSNTENDKGIIWKTGIVMSIRVEGLIRGYEPSSNDQEYEDQEYNAYVLNGIPYRKMLNIIGPPRGLPDWFIDKMNVIFTVNSLTIDGIAYAKFPGESLQVTRPEKGYNEDGYVQIKIQPNDNFNLTAYDSTGNGSTDELIVIAKQLPYYSNTANIAISGVFKTHTNLIGIAIWNRDLTAFVLKVGTTNGGNEIRQFNVSAEVTSFLLINKVFKEATNVYITSDLWSEVDANIRYDDYDAPNTGPGGGGSSAGPFFEENVEYVYYEDVIGNFVRDWNVPTGMGNVGTRFENCFLLDGQNDTLNDAYNFRMGWDTTVPALRQTIVGNSGNQVDVTTDVLPASGLNIFANMVQFAAPVPGANDFIARQRQAGGGFDYEAVKSNGETPTLGRTSNMGNGNPLDITPESLVVARFIYRKP